jgi:hypothetical protein
LCRVKDFVCERDETKQNLGQTKMLSSENLSNFTAKFQSVIMKVATLRVPNLAQKYKEVNRTEPSTFARVPLCEP